MPQSETAVSKKDERPTRKKIVKPKLKGDCMDDISGSSLRPKRKSRGSPVNGGTIDDDCKQLTSKKKKFNNSNTVGIKKSNINTENHKEENKSEDNITKKKKVRKRKAPLQRTSKKKGAKKVPAKRKPKLRAKRKTKKEKITDQLEVLGIKESEKTGNCARAAIYKGFIELTGNVSDLDQVVMSGKLECGHDCSATLRNLLDQPDYAGLDYEDGLQDATVFCDQNTEANGWEGCNEGRTYVTRICTGEPQFDCGKFHNHCTECKNFGKCIYDYRNVHCWTCGKHYFQGMSGFPCPTCERGGGSSRGNDCSIQ